MVRGLHGRLTCADDLLGTLVAVGRGAVGDSDAAVLAYDVSLRLAIIAERWPRTGDPLVALNAVSDGSLSRFGFVGAEPLSKLGVHLCPILPFSESLYLNHECLPVNLYHNGGDVILMGAVVIGRRHVRRVGQGSLARAGVASVHERRGGIDRSHPVGDLPGRQVAVDAVAAQQQHVAGLQLYGGEDGRAGSGAVADLPEDEIALDEVLARRRVHLAYVAPVEAVHDLLDAIALLRR